MTDVYIKSATCECEYDAKDTKTKLVIVEGNTTLWACAHVDSYTKQRKEVWELKT